MLEKFQAYSSITYFIKTTIKTRYGIEVTDEDLNLKISKGRGNLYTDVAKILYYKYNINNEPLESLASNLSSYINGEATHTFSTESLLSGGLIIKFENRFYIDIIRSLNSTDYKANFATFNYKNVFINYGIINTIGGITIPDLRKFILGNVLTSLFREEGIYINSHLAGYPHSNQWKRLPKIVEQVVDAIKNHKYDESSETDGIIKDCCMIVRKDFKCIDSMDESVIRERAQRIIESKMNNDYGYRSMIGIMPVIFNFRSILVRNRNITEQILKNNNINSTDKLLETLSLMICDYRKNTGFLISIIDNEDKHEYEISKSVLSKESPKVNEVIIPFKKTKIVSDYIKDSMIRSQEYRFFLHGLDEDLLIFMLAYIGNKKFVIDNFEKLFDKDSQFYKDLNFIKRTEHKLKNIVVKFKNYYSLRNFYFIREENMDLSVLNEDKARVLFNKILESEVIKYKCKERLNITYIPKYLKELAVLVSSYIANTDLTNKTDKEKNVIIELIFLADSIIASMLDMLEIRLR